jgi:hypothetical protein
VLKRDIRGEEVVEGEEVHRVAVDLLGLIGELVAPLLEEGSLLLVRVAYEGFPEPLEVVQRPGLPIGSQRDVPSTKDLS